MFAGFLRQPRHASVQRNRSLVFFLKCRRVCSGSKDSSDGHQIVTENLITENTCTITMAKDLKDQSTEDMHQGNLQVKVQAFLTMVDEAALTSQQLEIHRAHMRALKAGEMFYTDPGTGYQVMTRLAHLQRGNCCGNACRHCPFGQKNAPEELKRTYNSAFYE